MSSKKGVNPDSYNRVIELLNEQLGPEEMVQQLLDLADQGRTSRKAVEMALATPDTGPQQGPVMAELARQAGFEAGAEVPVRRLLRLASHREQGARVRTNPRPRNEAFTCAQCGEQVLPADRGIQRNHCPRCLYSLHVDQVPGDRASDCGGLMEPIGLEELSAERGVIRYRCTVCGAENRNRAALRCTVQPDSQQALRKLSVMIRDGS